MVTRLSPADAAFYRFERSATPMYVGTLSILRRPRGGLSLDTLFRTIEQRLPQIPRYRQKVRDIGIGLGKPVWLDDPDFDITYHVRRSALPSPGSDEQLHDLVARLAARPMDKTRPLWEMYLVENLAGNRLALYTKTHQALINGIQSPEINHVIADRKRRPPDFPEDIWVPERDPGTTRLVLGAIGDLISGPGAQVRGAVSTLAGLATDPEELLGAGRRAVRVVQALARGTAPASPLNAAVSHNRRFTVASADLDDYRRVRARYNCAVNDVMIAVIAGALGKWLMSRGYALPPTRTVRAMIPLPVRTGGDLDQSGPGQLIGHVVPYLVTLPIGERNAGVRLSQIAHMTEALPGAAGLLDARTIVALSGFAPPTLHGMSIRVATSYPSLSKRAFNLLISNAPGAQSQMYVAGVKLLESYAVPPLLPGQVLAIGVTSYNERVYFGINADRDAMSDVELLPGLIGEALEELLDASR